MARKADAQRTGETIECQPVSAAPKSGRQIGIVPEASGLVLLLLRHFDSDSRVVGRRIDKRVRVNGYVRTLIQSLTVELRYLSSLRKAAS